MGAPTAGPAKKSASEWYRVELKRKERFSPVSFAYSAKQCASEGLTARMPVAGSLGSALVRSGFSIQDSMTGSNTNKKRLQQELQPFKGKTFFRVGLSQAALL